MILKRNSGNYFHTQNNSVKDLDIVIVMVFVFCHCLVMFIFVTSLAKII